jgi:hypothetical protein
MIEAGIAEVVHFVYVKLLQLGTVVGDLDEALAREVLAGEEVEGGEGAEVFEEVGEGLVRGTPALVGALHLVAVQVQVEAAGALKFCVGNLNFASVKMEALQNWFPKINQPISVSQKKQDDRHGGNL